MLVYELSGRGLEFICCQLTFRFCAFFDQAVPWQSGSYRAWILSEWRPSNDKNIYQIPRTGKYSQRRSIIWIVWRNGWVFVFKVIGCGFQFSSSHLKFSFCACFEQPVPLQSGNCRVWIHSEMHTWHDKNIQSNGLYR